jgi:Gas vesicle protein
MTEPTTAAPWGDTNALVDLLDRVIEKGAVVTGDVVISLAGVDLIRLDLRLLLAGVESVLDAVTNHDAVTNRGDPQ